MQNKNDFEISYLQFQNRFLSEFIFKIQTTKNNHYLTSRELHMQLFTRFNIFDSI